MNNKINLEIVERDEMTEFKLKNKIILNKDYKTPITEILAASSLAYLLSPTRSKRLFIKVICILFMIIFFSASFYYVLLNIFDYLQYDTITSIYQVHEQEADFPTISFCDTRDSNFNIKIIYFWFQNENLLKEWPNHFESYVDKKYGRCYRFNSGKNMFNQTIPIKKSIRAGLDDAFYLNFYFNTTYDSSLPMIYIHNNTDRPDSIYHKGYYFSSGSVNYFNIKRTLDQRLGLPYNNCFKNVSESDLNQTVIKSMNENNIEYSQKECLRSCINLKFKEMKACNQSYDEENIFFFASRNKCIEEFIRQKGIHDLCMLNYCPLDCDHYSYDISLHSASETATGNISMKSSTNYVGFNTYENVSRTFYGLRVYYDELEYTLIIQQPKIEPFGLISNIGGTLGLFIGFSFISILELVEVVVELVFIRFF